MDKRSRDEDEWAKVLGGVVDSLSTCVIVADARAHDLPVVYVNPAFTQLTGYSAAEVKGRNCRFLLGTDRDQAGLPALREALARGIACTVVLRNYRKDGRLFFNELTVSPLRDPSGVLTHFVAIQADVTDRIERERALKKSDERMRAMLDGSLDAVYVLECWRDAAGELVDFTFVDINKNAEHQLGMSRSQLIDHRICEVFPINRNDGYFEKYKRVFESRVALEQEYLIPGSGTATGWFYQQVVPLSDGVAIINRGISERKANEEALRSAVREKENLLRELYHRTKNNMMVISSLLALQGANAGNESVKATLRDVRSRIDCMAMVHRKLYESQSLSEIALHEYIEDVVRLLALSHQQPSQAIELRFDLQPVAATLDKAVPIGLVLNELVSNAFKHGFDGRPRGTLTVRLSRSEAGSVTIEVADDGRGVPAGFDLHDGTTFGAQIMVRLVEHQLRGEIRFHREGGLRCVVDLPAGLMGSDPT